MSQFDEMVAFLDSAYCLKDQLVPCLVGPVGIGKTAAVMQHAENVKANKVVTIIASQILPNEVSGITMPDSDSKAMEIYDHYRLSSLEDGDIVFFDELLEADQMVLSACLTLIESRQMMSGRKLPDVQIIAATNPTIQPNMLKENIRQRFIFRKFDLDPNGCREFIKNETGVDIKSLLSELQETSNEYNILSQRSMTKMVRWMINSNDKKKTACIIDKIWNSQLGTKLYNIINRSDNEMENKAKKAMLNMLARHAPISYASESDVWSDCSMSELMEIINNMIPEIKDNILNDLDDIVISVDNEQIEF